MHGLIIHDEFDANGSLCLPARLDADMCCEVQCYDAREGRCEQTLEPGRLMMIVIHDGDDDNDGDLFWHRDSLQSIGFIAALLVSSSSCLCAVLAYHVGLKTLR